jgi:phosphate transport system permease protein
MSENKEIRLDDISEAKKKSHSAARKADKTAGAVIWVAAVIGLLLLAFIIVTILWRGLAIALNPKFLTGSPAPLNQSGGGILPMIVSSLYLAFLTLVISLPIGIAAAIYMSEFAREGLVTRAVRFGADALSTVPSVIFGIFGLILFVTYLGLHFSLLSGALTLTFLNLPVIMRNTEQAIRQVPNTYREASIGLGAGKWYTVRKVVLPSAIPGIMTGGILTMGRVIGESAAVILTVGITTSIIPVSPLDSGAPLAANIYQLYSEGALIPDYLKIAAGEACVLLIIVLMLNVLARLIARHYKKMGSGRFV